MRRASLIAADRLPLPDVPPEPWPARRLRVNGLATQVRRAPPIRPDAQPAAYVHGLGGSSQDWTDLAGLLAGRLDGEAVDLPGFGGSEPLRRYSLTGLAAHVVAWLTAADRGPVHLFGNSMGGAVAVLVAAHRPDLVRSLTLISPAMPFLNPLCSELGPVAPLLWLPGATAAVRWSMRRAAPEGLTLQTIRHCLVDPDAVPAQRLADLTSGAGEWLLRPWHAEAYVHAFRALVAGFVRSYLPGGGSLWSAAARIATPTLVVWGRQDRLVPVALAPRLTATVPDGRLLVVDRAGHAVHLEHAGLVARAALAMIDSGADGPEGPDHRTA